MLTDLQRKAVWEGWLGSEIRSLYFADLSYRYQRSQRIITWLTLAFSSGAFAVIVSDGLPAELNWLRAGLTFLTAALSLWSLVAQNQKRVTDCADLHFGWNTLGIDYQRLWDDMYSDDAASRLESLNQKEAELSKRSLGFPNRVPLLKKWQDHVEQHHQAA